MKVFAFVLVASILVFSYTGEADCGKHRCYSFGWDFDLFECNDVEIDLEDGSIIFTYENGRVETVEITEDYRLFVNDRRIETNEEQDELLEEYHNQIMDIVDMAKEIGREGAKIGICGAKVGLKAVAGVVKLILWSYDRDDLERDVEREAEKLEVRARKIERMAERIEDLADDLENLHRGLRRGIPALHELDWF